MSPILSPCKDCPDRQANPPCHSTYPRYLEYDAERKLIRDARRKEREIDDYIIDSAISSKAKKKRSRKEIHI